MKTPTADASLRAPSSFSAHASATIPGDAGSPKGVGSAVALARQPIYDAEQNIFAYELLYRDFGGQSTDVEKTSSLLNTAFLDISIGAIAGKHPVFINFDINCLAAGLAETLSPERCVIELLETVPADDDVRNYVEQLRRLDYRIALDDWRPGDHRADLLALADFVKLDWPEFTPAELKSTIGQLRRYSLELLAEKIERTDEFAVAKSFGIELFQGYLFARPTRIEGRRIPAWMRICLQLLQLTKGDEFDVVRCVRLIEQDPMLCHKLLRFANSASLSLRQEVQSIRTAVSYLGRKGIRQLVSKVLSVGTSQRPAPEMTQVLLHAKFSELLSQRAHGDTDAGFLAGLLRGLHENLDLPLEQLMQDLSVTTELRDALLHGSGALGDVLEIASSFDACGGFMNASASSIPLPIITQSFSVACQWTDELLSLG